MTIIIALIRQALRAPHKRSVIVKAPSQEEDGGGRVVLCDTEKWVCSTLETTEDGRGPPGAAGSLETMRLLSICCKKPCWKLHQPVSVIAGTFFLFSTLNLSFKVRLF